MILKSDIELIRAQLDYGPGSNGASDALSRIEASLSVDDGLPKETLGHFTVIVSTNISLWQALKLRLAGKGYEDLVSRLLERWSADESSAKSSVEEE